MAFCPLLGKKNSLSYPSGKEKKKPVNHYQNDFLESHLKRFINLKRLKTVLLKDILTGKGVRIKAAKQQSQLLSKMLQSSEQSLHSK